MTKPRRPESPADESGLDRRTFLKTAAAGAATAAAMTATAQVASAAEAKPAKKEGEANMRGASFVSRPGSDFMVDVIKTLNIEYVASNPASSFRSLHESLVNYGGNKKPEFLTCMHEESSVAHGARLREGRRQADGDARARHASACSTRRWPSTTPGPIACRC